MPRIAHAVLGGTFDRLHAGHAALLSAAFAAGRRVSVGVTTDAFVRSLGKPRGGAIQPYPVRRRTLGRWIARHFPGREWRLVPLADRFGRSVEAGVGVLIVSAETAGGGRAVNAERRRRGRRPVPVVVVPLVLADDLGPVSSRRIRAGEIDRSGRRRSPILVGVAAESAPDRLAALSAVRSAFPTARMTLVPASAAPRGPTARRAFRLAERARGRRDLGVGVARDAVKGWVVAVRSSAVALDPRAIPGTAPGDLRRGLLRVLAPRRPQAL